MERGEEDAVDGFVVFDLPRRGKAFLMVFFAF
jgi:hypothetical protein